MKAHYLFDGETKIRDGAVLTSDGQIEAAGSRSEIGDVDDAIVYDFGDATLMPGLIDCHDHLTSGLLEFGQNRYVSTSWAILKAANDLKLTLERGFTTVRDCGGLDLGVKKAVQAGLIPGPRLVISLVIVTQSAGLADDHYIGDRRSYRTPHTASDRLPEEYCRSAIPGSSVANGVGSSQGQSSGDHPGRR
ncbi:MAG: amidohydrolase family protein [Bacillota bacterium]